jgi:hypothetical protein
MVADFFQAQYDADLNSTDDLVGHRNTWNKEGRALFWGVPGRTLSAVIDGINSGAPRLEMPPSPPPSPPASVRWQPRITYSFSSNSSSSGLARSAPSSHRATPYIMLKREVKEEPEYATPPAIRRHSNNDITISEPARQQQRRTGGARLILKPEVKEEQNDEEAAKAAQMAEYELRQCLIANRVAQGCTRRSWRP